MFDTTPGGRYRVNGVLVDAEGKPLKGEAAEVAAPDETTKDTRGGEFGADFPYRDILEKAGFADQGAVWNANDEDLLALDGIGPARLREIREYQNP